MFDSYHFRHWGPGRMFHKGDFKYVILDLLKDKPKHGYEIIRELEEKFHGFYSPSPGTVYPTLQYLEEAGYVTSDRQEVKRVYTITEEGRKFLAEQAKNVDDIHDRAWPGSGPGHTREGWEFWSAEFRDQFRDVMGEIRDLGRLIGRRARGMNGEKLRRIGEILKKAYSEIEKIISEEPAPRA
ncbi:MAG: PadR family transcriptional regulator [Candidatus Aminicenantales bacterium]